MTELLSRDHSILEKGMMEFRPFGVDTNGQKIRDTSGITVRANAEYLREVVERTQGKAAGAHALDELARLLNERILDKAYHVTPEFLMDVWNSYSYEFVMFLAEFCTILSNDPQFQYHMGQEKLISPIIQTLGRPFGVHQIYKMFPHFGQKYAKGSLHFESETITDHSAVLRMKFTEHLHRQFGPYRKACAYHICQSSKAALGAFPHLIYGLQPATIVDRACIAEGDEYCEWEFTWVPKEPRALTGAVAALIISGATIVLLIASYPAISWVEAVIMSAFPGAAIWFANATRVLRNKLGARDRIIQEQVAFVDIRHEELREAYLVQQQAAVDLKRRVGQLTLLYQTGMIVSSTLDREALIHTALSTIERNLNFNRVMLSFYDQEKKISYDARLIGVPDEIAAFARSLNTPVTDSSTIEGQLLLEGIPILIRDIREVWDRLHPLSQQLATLTRAQSIIAVPLKVKGRVIGSLTVDRLQDHTLNEEDLSVMITVANQLAIALEHAAAYRQIEEMNIGLEEKVQERTTALAQANQELRHANERLQELDRLKSAFVSIASHELRTPMTSIRGYVENMLDGLTGPLTEKQSQYLSRVKYNIDRLTRMTADLLDLSRIEAGRVELRLEYVSVTELIEDVVEGLRSMTGEKSLALKVLHSSSPPPIQADRDKLAQILTNLIGNAIKFTPSGGTIEIKTEVQNNTFLYVGVSDTGCGIQPDELPRVFEKFFRGGSVQTDVRGAGLGLAIVKSLVELHGGHIEAESIPGTGSHFFFTLPLHHS